MLRIGLIGLGFMGRAHLENYLRLEREGADIYVAALCDVDPGKLEGQSSGGNLDAGSSAIDFSRFVKYTSLSEMLEKEQLDMVDITLPTFLHREVAVQCLNSGVHVLCEKPMALNSEDCEAMIEASERKGKLLMIGHCLRFWPAYVYLKDVVDTGTFGQAMSGYFYRGGSTPTWGGWLTQREKSGGAMVDMHIHDTDVINWVFGMPQEVSSHARIIIPGSGYDVVSTHYKYADGKVINAQADWTLQGDYGFEMAYRVNFERGNLVFSANELKVNPNDAPGFVAELSPELGYYYQLRYFVESVIQQRPVTTASPASTMDSIRILEAELESADRKGEWITVKL
ncbi:Gfo/Idh/MocA family oxidoreductase [Paenibacillus filicis]|uniref:Gfo/Idh/MocA family oxidoreductase n=1 Tax=Paenibacillus gyeongsangnamensis TaxID=3388067 RepID=A0ABT4Q4S8_9BACL|nr:Gfo/Idh/MocA family oxidoreductase [Paenibacillus filicis]MCZ8511828.1 Gfo/Idh/MocA family oxidoreductase [Paenibacillus filicis]